ncbi:MAG TPA: hypothetical protein VHM24_11085 [Gemmatimonadaceae bacterium]|nr:hypothetical protein [Gemmatimonadaceae bacterium]
MTTAASSIAASRPFTLSTWLRTGAAVALSDGLFACATAVFVPPIQTPLRLFQGVATVAFGKEMLQGGVPTGAVGILMHFTVAMFWSGVFLLALTIWPELRHSVQSWPRAMAIAAVYGVSIWLTMTWIVIPALLHRPPTIGLKYVVQLIGHIPFVAMPMILVNRRTTA